MKKCDHKSVGMLVWKDGKLLMIERANYPFGFAVPAGHVDEDRTFEDAARRELKEEVGLGAAQVELIYEGRKENPCRREGGTWHHWKLYRVDVSGNLSGNLDETRRIGWFSMQEVRKRAGQTEKYLRKEISETDWEKDPGLEPVMRDLFIDIKII